MGLKLQPPVNHGPTTVLTEATVQAIQLELLRRCQLNALNGAQVVADLEARCTLWSAAMLTRHGDEMGVVLRDLPDNLWNADTLWVLAVDQAAAAELCTLAKTWRADSVRVLSAKKTARFLGIVCLTPESEGEHAGELVIYWWD